MKAIEYRDGEIRAIDQTALPARERWLQIRSTAQLAHAIKRLKIRGAPMLGIAGAYGVAAAARRSRKRDAIGVMSDARDAGAILQATRPTAVNLAWAIRRMLDVGQAVIEADTKDATDPVTLRVALEAEAHRILHEDEAACLKMAKTGQIFVPRRDARILTHCNTGFLCTGGYGTALGVIRLAHEKGKRISVLAGETRPLLQGARLTAWELSRLGVPFSLIPDSAGAGLIARGEVDLVIVGADRIAANGDVVNKVGTYPLALAAKESKVPFVVVAPTSTIDPAVASGADIEIEQREPDEVVRILGRVQVAPPGTLARNPAFDVTPAKFVTALVTERGIARPPSRSTIKALLK